MIESLKNNQLVLTDISVKINHFNWLEFHQSIFSVTLTTQKMVTRLVY